MVTKKVLIVKILFVLMTIMPYIIFIGPNDFFRNVIICSCGFYFLLNIFVCTGRFKFIKYLLNVFDGGFIIVSVFFIIFLTVLAYKDPEEGGHVFILYPVLLAIMALGIMGLYLNKCNSSQH
jgi:hypothetical protein